MRDANDVLREDGPGAVDPERGLVPAWLTDATSAGPSTKSARLDLEEHQVGRGLDDALRRLKVRAEGRERPVQLPWDSVNSALGGGLWPGLHIVVGNTGCGKTQFVLGGALHAARHGSRVVYMGLELGPLDFAARLLGLCLDTHWSSLFLGQDVRGLAAAEHAMSQLADLPFHILDATSGIGTTADIGVVCAEARALADGTGSDGQGVEVRPVLVVVDFLQIIRSADGSRDDLRERIGKAAYASRQAAVRHDASVLVLSSTARENYALLRHDETANCTPEKKKQPFGQGDPARFVGLGKESGEIEFAADTVLVLGRGERPQEMHLGVAKLRAGVTGWARLAFDGSQFREWTEPAPVEECVVEPRGFGRGNETRRRGGR
jgi:replicative DNA helicase